MLVNDGVEREIDGIDDGLGDGHRDFVGGGKVEVFGANDAVDRFEKRGLEDGGQFADVAGPGVLEQACERAGAESDGALPIAGADSFQQRLGERGDVFAAHAEGRNDEADSAEAKGQVGQKQALAGHLAQRGLRGGEQDGAAGRAVLQGFQNAEEQALSGRGEQVDAVKIDEAGQGGGIGVSDQPFAGIAALEGARGERGAAEEIAGEGLFAGAVFALNGGQLHVGRCHFSLHQQLSPGCAYTCDRRRLRRGGFNEGKARDGGLGLELSDALHGFQRASPSWPGSGDQANRCLIGIERESMNRKGAEILAGME